MESVENWIAAAVCILIGMKFPRHNDIEAPYVVAFMLIPLWLRALRGYRWATLIISLGGAAILSGVALSGIQATTHQLSTSNGIMMSARVAGVALCVGMLFWARDRLGRFGVAAWVGVGMVAGIPVNGGLEEGNPWKFALSIPLCILALSLAAMSRRRWLEIVALLVASGISALNDSRSAAAILFMAAVVTATQAIGRLGGRARVWWIIARGVIVALLVYLVAQTAILDGYLGQETQERSLRQVEGSGSLILGGRPELGATLALLHVHPWGLGSATLPSLGDVLAAKSGMASLDYDPNNGYVDLYMFGHGIEVHSMLGDIWLLFGLAGIVFLLLSIALPSFDVATRLAAHRASALEIFLAAECGWNLLFSPFPTSMLPLMLLAAVGVVRRRSHRGDEASRWKAEPVMQPVETAPS